MNTNEIIVSGTGVKELTDMLRKLAVEDKFHSINRNLMRRLIDDGIIKSFTDIKKIDRIEFGNDIYDMARLINNINIDSSFFMHIPFINEGVLKYHCQDGIVYNHFIVKNVNVLERTLNIDMDIYKFSSYKYFEKIVDFGCLITQVNEGDKSCSIRYEDTHYSFDYVYKNYEINNTLNLSKYDYSTYSLFRTIHNEKMQGILDGVYEGDDEIIEFVSFFINCIVVVNNYIELQKNNKINHDSSSINNTNKNNSSNNHAIQNDSKDEIIIINGIKIKKGKNSQIKVSKGKLINRQTQVWGVVGHIRHYKSGKTVYIKPYEKGPGRSDTDKKHKRKIYKIKGGKTNE